MIYNSLLIGKSLPSTYDGHLFTSLDISIDATMSHHIEYNNNKNITIKKQLVDFIQNSFYLIDLVNIH